MATAKIDHGSKAMDMNNHEMIRDRGMVFMHLSYHLSELMNNSKVVSELASLVVRWSAIMMLDKDRKFQCSVVSRCRVFFLLTLLGPSFRSRNKEITSDIQKWGWQGNLSQVIGPVITPKRTISGSEHVSLPQISSLECKGFP